MILRNITICLMLLFGLAACDAPAERDQIVWEASLPWSVKEFHTTNARNFAAAVSEATNGALKINIHPGGVLGLKGPSSLRALGEGIVDMAEMPFFQQVGTEPLLGVESLPFLVEDQWELSVLYEIMTPRINEILGRHNMKMLYIVPWPNQNLYFREQVESVAEMAGIKIRTYDRNSSNMVTRLNMNAVQLPSSDVVPALASGMIDAAMTSTTTGAAQRFDEFLNYIYRTNHLWITNVMAVNLDAWNALPKETQDKVEALAAEMQAEFWAVSAADDMEKLRILEERGITTVEPLPEMIRDLQALARPMWREFAEMVPGAHQVICDYLAATSKPPLGLEFKPEDEAS